MVPPPSQVQAPRVDAAPLVSVSRPPPRARPASRLPSFPAYPLPQYASPLLSTTSPPAPPAFGRCRGRRLDEMRGAPKVPPPAPPQSRRRSPRTRPTRRPRWQHARASCRGRPRPRCARPRRAHAPPLACARRPFFCPRRGAEEEPPHDPRRADDPATAARRRPPHHTHSLPLSHHSHPPFLPSPSLQPHPPSPLRASRHPTPLNPRTTPPAVVPWLSCGLVASLCLI